MTIRYEEMISDTEMEKWPRVFSDLGFGGAELPACLSSVWKHSLFGEKRRDPEHMFDGSVSQWKRTYTDEMLELFEEAFPDACGILGYEE